MQLPNFAHALWCLVGPRWPDRRWPSAQRRECVAGAPSVPPRLLLAVPLGRTDLPGSRIDPTHLGGVRASCPRDQSSTVGFPVFIPSWLVTANKDTETQHFKYRLPKEVKAVGCALSTLCDQRLQSYSTASAALIESLHERKLQVLDSISGRQSGWSTGLSPLLSREHTAL